MRLFRSQLSVRQVLLAGLSVSAPTLGGIWLAAGPQNNREFLLDTEHFLIVTFVSLLALGVAVLVALQMEQYSVALVALGFMSMAGFFAVHALATPGVPLHSMTGAVAQAQFGSPPVSTALDDYTSAAVVRYDYGGTVIGFSAFMSLFVPSILFAASNTQLAAVVLRKLPAHSTVLGVCLIVAGYATLASSRSDVIASLVVSRPPFSYASAAVTVALLAFAAWHQGLGYIRTRFPTHGALVLAYVLLAQAQILMAASAFWSLAWWEYHVVMLAASVLALGALFVELRRRRALERFLPPPIVERIVAGDLNRLMNGERRVATILFADLRGSTALAEHLDPHDVVLLLNDYVGALAHSVVSHGGMMRQFLGDGLMAIFGVFETDSSDGAAAAVRATLEMRRAMSRVNDARSLPSTTRMRFGVGIHTGEVVLGTIGIRQQAEITALRGYRQYSVSTAGLIQAVWGGFGAVGANGRAVTTDRGRAAVPWID
jgi:class 3 adenylate cyclase